MTDYERKRRNECIKLRAQHERDRREIRELESLRAENVRALSQMRTMIEVLQAKLGVWERAAAAFGKGKEENF